MNDKNKVIAGIVIFFVLLTSPFWYNLLAAKTPAPEVVLTAKAKAAKVCVRDTAWMKANHMQLLDEWRDAVVLKSERIYVSPDGKEYNMSLSNTCLDCHSNYTEFCQRCHEYASIEPYCWECHINNPKETE
ncbi:MAG: sulfate reduction electron transfer complex DsrMKJOP subunit DsrJ [Desulfobacterales bacterium]|nr:sulfate reduction electron transfer complex DsrMKJOP subunit DsrJ [Desulfobacterales bacterium]